MHDIADQLAVHGLEGPVLALDPSHAAFEVAIGLFPFVEQGVPVEHPLVEGPRFGRDGGKQLVEPLAEAGAVGPAGRQLPGRTCSPADAGRIIENRRSLRNDRGPTHLLQADFGEILQPVAGRHLLHVSLAPADGSCFVAGPGKD